MNSARERASAILRRVTAGIDVPDVIFQRASYIYLKSENTRVNHPALVVGALEIAACEFGRGDLIPLIRKSASGIAYGPRTRTRVRAAITSKVQMKRRIKNTITQQLILARVSLHESVDRGMFDGKVNRLALSGFKVSRDGLHGYIDLVVNEARRVLKIKIHPRKSTVQAAIAKVDRDFSHVFTYDTLEATSGVPGVTIRENLRNIEKKLGEKKLGEKKLGTS